MSKNIFLYLALACLFSLLTVFIFDGYLGVHDTIFITSGERKEEIQPDLWQQRDMVWPVDTNPADTVFLSYKIENRRFSGYSDQIEAAVWQQQQKKYDLESTEILISSFDTVLFEWEVDNTDILPGDNQTDELAEYTIIIKRGELERRLIIYVSPNNYPFKAAPIRPR